MNNQIETLFTTALGLQPPWHVTRVELDTGKGADEVDELGPPLPAGAVQAPGCHIEGAPGRRRARHMLDGRSNAYVEAMNGLLQQTKTAARGFRNIENFIAMAYLRMSRLAHLPQNPMAPAIPRDYGCYRHVCS